MALVVEDGTGRADAEAYASVSDADTWHANRGATTWAALSTAAKEQALRKATDYMAAFRGRWAGFRKSSTQALDWPRYYVEIRDSVAGFGQEYYDDSSVPQAVKNACAELALKAAAGTTLAPDLDPQAIREKVGPIETEYAPGARQTTRFYSVEVMLAPFFCGSSGSLRVSRA